MNNRRFLRFRMLVEFITALIFVIAAVDIDRVRISNHIWLDIPCRLLLAILALVIFSDVITLQRESRVK
jgi:hypothetical protein